MNDADARKLARASGRSCAMTSSTDSVALGSRLELDEHASGVRAAGRVVADQPDVDADAGDVRVLQQDVGDLQLVLAPCR